MMYKGAVTIPQQGAVNPNILSEHVTRHGGCHEPAKGRFGKVTVNQKLSRGTAVTGAKRLWQGT